MPAPMPSRRAFSLVGSPLGYRVLGRYAELMKLSKAELVAMRRQGITDHLLKAFRHIEELDHQPGCSGEWFHRSIAAREVSWSSSVNSQGPELMSKLEPNPTHLPVRWRPVGSTSSCMAP